MSNWYYTNKNGEKVQITGGQLKGLAKAGLITAETIVEHESGKSAPAGKVKGLTFGVLSQPVPVKPVEPSPFVATAPPVSQTIPQSVPTATAGGKSSLLVTVIGIMAISGVAFAGWKIIEATAPPVEQAKVVIPALDEEWADEEWVDDDEWTEENELADDGNKNGELPTMDNEGIVQTEPPVNEYQFTPAEQAEIGRFLAKHGNDVKAVKNGYTLLHRACMYRDFDENNLLSLFSTPEVCWNVAVAKYLVSKGVDVHAKDNYGKTPLHNAAFTNNIEIVKYLVSKGANIHAKGNNGATPLNNAIRDVDSIMAYNRLIQTVAFLVSKGADVNAKDSEGDTPLHSAAFFGHVDIAKFLVSKGADVNAKNSAGETPLNDVRAGIATTKKKTEMREYLRSVGGKATPASSRQSVASTPSRPTPSVTSSSSSSSTASTPRASSSPKPPERQICTTCSGTGQRIRQCPNCNGRGYGTFSCVECKGSGKTRNGNMCHGCNGKGFQKCGRCKATGMSPPEQCGGCNGKGYR